MSKLVLSTVRPDFEALVNQFITRLSTSDSWADRITSSTGQTLTELVASIGAYDQFSIESAFQEVFPESAKNTRSLYAASSYLGIRTSRKNPASVTFNMQAAEAITLQPLTQFSGGGTFWFNRSALVLGPTPTLVTLYQGKIVSTTVNGGGTDFQAFVSPEKGFVVSDTDVFLSINNTSVPVVVEGLWTLVGVPGVQNLTLADGRMILLFGNSLFGSTPGVNDLCTLTYATTLGQDGNNVPITGKIIQSVDFPTISGTVTGSATGGGDQPNPLVYKNVTPALFGSFDSAVTPAQYKRLPLTYPGILDAQTFSQREVNPNALTWMNVIKICLLTSSVWDSVAWNNFIAWYQKKTMFSGHFLRQDPIPNVVNITAQLFCKPFSNLANVLANANAAIVALLTPRQGIIGMDVYIEDITTALKLSDSNIVYIPKPTFPTTDIVTSSLAVDAPTLVPSTGGVLVAGTIYQYAISLVSSLGGESAPANWSTLKLEGSQNSITLNWNPVTTAQSYKIWGRILGGAVGYIATVTVPTTTFFDLGTTLPTGSAPSEGTINIVYPKLGALNLTAGYSTRSDVLR
jgi:hypothetical protein